MVSRPSRDGVGNLFNGYWTDLRDALRGGVGRRQFTQGLNLTALHAKAITLHLRRCLRHYSGPFDDVPEFPTVVVRDRLFPHANDREVLYLRSAIAIIA